MSHRCPCNIEKQRKQLLALSQRRAYDVGTNLDIGAIDFSCGKGSGMFDMVKYDGNVDWNYKNRKGGSWINDLKQHVESLKSTPSTASTASIPPLPANNSMRLIDKINYFNNYFNEGQYKNGITEYQQAVRGKINGYNSIGEPYYSTCNPETVTIFDLPRGQKNGSNWSRNNQRKPSNIDPYNPEYDPAYNKMYQDYGGAGESAHYSATEPNNARGCNVLQRYSNLL